MGHLQGRYAHGAWDGNTNGEDTASGQSGGQVTDYFFELYQSIYENHCRLRYHQGGWSSANSGYGDECDQGVIWTILAVLVLHSCNRLR